MEPKEVTPQSLAERLQSVAERLRWLGKQRFIRDCEDVAADLIERQAAQIERMRAALVEAQRWITEDRAAFEACSRPVDDTHWIEADAAVLKRMDELLRMIDEAMGDEDDR